MRPAARRGQRQEGDSGMMAKKADRDTARLYLLTHAVTELI